MSTTTALRSNLPALPDRIKRLPVDERGYPVPYFVAWLDAEGNPCKPEAHGSKPEFRAMDAEKRIKAVSRHLCWICGDKLGTRFAFVAGPMCGVSRISAEPPSHRECAEFAVKACPFMVMPKAVRRENDLPEGVANPVGTMIERNPGVSMVWLTRGYGIIRDTSDTFLFEIGQPFEVLWFREGRPASREEVLSAIDSGIPLLVNQSKDETDLESQRARLAEWLPKI